MPRLSTLPSECFKALVQHAVLRISVANGGLKAQTQQSILGYFLLIAIDHADGVIPSIARLRDQTGMTHAGIVKPLTTLAEIGLIERDTFKNSKGAYEVYFTVSASAIRAATRM
jgi:DNA-binding MarR family transcriptional regulator